MMHTTETEVAAPEGGPEHVSLGCAAVIIAVGVGALAYYALARGEGPGWLAFGLAALFAGPQILLSIQRELYRSPRLPTIVWAWGGGVTLADRAPVVCEGLRG